MTTRCRGYVGVVEHAFADIALTAEDRLRSLERWLDHDPALHEVVRVLGEVRATERVAAAAEGELINYYLLAQGLDETSDLPSELRDLGDLIDE